MSIDFSKIPRPAVIEELSFEQILAARKNRLVELMPDAASVIDIESEPLNILLQENAYRELLLRQRINDSALAGMLAYATGQDLDAIGEDRYKLPRLVITPENTSTTPPTPPVMESDTAYRERLYLSIDALSTAGPKGQYESLARSASGDVADATAVFVSEGRVEIAVVTHSNAGTASTELLDIVQAACADDDRRPMTDYVTVVQSSIVPVSIDVVLEFDASVDSAGVAQAMAEATAALNALKAWRKIGAVLAESKLHSLLHVEGVRRVLLASPVGDVVPAETETIIVTTVSIVASQGNAA